MELNQENINKSFEIFFATANNILDKHAPLRRMSIQEARLSKRPWITPGILKSIKNKDILRRKQ